MLKENVIKAYDFAQRKHDGVSRKFFNQPYFVHPKGVARIIEELTNDEDMVAAALLHDVLEDTNTKQLELLRNFGRVITQYVEELTTDKEELKNKCKATVLFNKMRHISNGAYTIKLADRLHNLMYLDYDRADTEFITRNWRESKSILSRVQKVRCPNANQEILLTKIYTVLDFLELRYDLKEKE